MFSLLAASAAGRLKTTLSELGGIGENLTSLIAAKGEKSRFMAFELAMKPAKPADPNTRIAAHRRGLDTKLPTRH